MTMFEGIRRRLGADPVKLGGRTLPEEFRNGSLIDGVLFSVNGDKFAYINSDGEVKSGAVPPDGIVKIQPGEISPDSFNGANVGNVHISHISYSGGKLIGPTEVRAPGSKVD